MKAALLLCLACACAEPVPSRMPRGASLVVAPDASGWVHVREPGWFAVDMPSSPHSGLLPDRTPEGATFAYKKIAAAGADGLFSIGYVDLGADPARRFAHMIAERYDAHPAAGLHLEPAHDVTIDGAPAKGLDGFADASSETNGAPFPIDAHVRVVARGDRLFQIQCSAPHASAASCDRFFASFRFE